MISQSKHNKKIPSSLYQKEIRLVKLAHFFPISNKEWLRANMFFATLILAGITIVLRVDSPVVWTFLGIAIGNACLRNL